MKDINLDKYNTELKRIKQLSEAKKQELFTLFESEKSVLVFKRGLSVVKKSLMRQPGAIVSLILCLTLDRDYLLDEIIHLAIENSVPMVFTYSREYCSKILNDKIYSVTTAVQSLKKLPLGQYVVKK